MITQGIRGWGGKKKNKKDECAEELEEKRNSFGDMATLCTKIGMPKYRENKKKWKGFLPGNTPANICHRRRSACVKVSASLYSMCQPCARLLNAQGYIFMPCESVYGCVYTSRQRVCLCDSIETSCREEYAFTHTHTCTQPLVCLHMYIQSRPLLISCTFCACTWKGAVLCSQVYARPSQVF